MTRKTPGPPAPPRTAANDARYRLIADGLARGEGAGLLREAQALWADEPSERATVALAVCLLRGAALDEAERVLCEFRDRHGETPMVRVNLGKVAAERGDVAAAEQLASAALHLDPNAEAALLWWAALVRARADDAAFAAQLRALAGRKGSWRVHLLLFGARLERGDVRAADSLQDALRAAPKRADAVTAIAVALLRAGEYRALLAALPDYSAARDGVAAGELLVRAALAVGDVAAARRVADALRLAGASSATAVDQLVQQRAAEVAPGDAPVVGAAVFPPLAAARLVAVAQALPSLTTATRVAVVTLRDLQTARGALCRAIALSTADVLRRAGMEAFALVPVVRGRGLLAPDATLSFDALLSLLPAATLPRFVLTGTLRDDAVDAQLHDLQLRRVVLETTAQGAPEEVVRTLAWAVVRAVAPGARPLTPAGAVLPQDAALVAFLLGAGFLDAASHGEAALAGLAETIAAAARRGASDADRELAVATFLQARDAGLAVDALLPTLRSVAGPRWAAELAAR